MKFKVIYFNKNQGHGKSRNASIEGTTNELVAMMDSDDIAVKDRFEREIKAHLKEDVSVVGGQIAEFMGESHNVVGIRKVPESNKEIYAYLKRRCPFNHMTVMFKKSDVLAAGSYRDWYCDEDYYLWIRMAERGMRFRNLPSVLVKVRVGEDMYKRRGGWKYFRSEEKLQRYMMKRRIIMPFRYMVNVGMRFGAQVICPDNLRKYLFKMVRKEKVKKEAVQENSINMIGAPKFSVAMSVYDGDSAEYFDAALKSVIKQTYLPDEIVLVVDGPINEKLQKIIDEFHNFIKTFGN